MDCSKIKELLSEYIDGTLDRRTKALIEEHLLTCRGCKEELDSLEALLKELRSLDAVDAPDDFLEKFHERMEPSPWFRRIMRILFVPWRIKIPLELTGAVATVLLIVSIIHIQQPEREMAGIPIGSTESMITKKITADTLESRLEKEGYISEPTFEERTAKQPKREERTIELALLLRTDEPERVHAPGAALEAAPAPRKRGATIQEEKTYMLSPPRARIYRETESNDEIQPGKLKGKKQSITWGTGEVKDFIGLIGGKVISVEYEKQTESPQSIHAEIPAKHYGAFCEKLKHLGPFRTPPPSISEKDEEIIRMRIRFVSYLNSHDGEFSHP
ncbi:MAG: hypothetical protein C4B58_15645 [Deltaproteobacteria bacterium]|nr:MAG: hypothetical protein C4B58_15645 [Deltaproteobacteria bacterium]